MSLAVLTALDTLQAILFILLYFLVLAVLGMAVYGLIAAASGLAGALAALPLLYVLPDVRRFVDRAVSPDGGRDGPLYRLAIRRRYLLFGVLFGVCYLVVLVTAAVTLDGYGLLERRVGRVPVVLAVPVGFAATLASIAAALQLSDPDGDAARPVSVVGQWTCFVGAAVAGASIAPVAAALAIGASVS